MNLEMLLKEYPNDSRCFTIADRVTATSPQQIHLCGLHCSITPFIVSTVFNHSATSQLNHVIILRDAEEAAYFHNTLENISGALNLFYFPSVSSSGPTAPTLIFARRISKSNCSLPQAAGASSRCTR